jgi:hypothetical protein
MNVARISGISYQSLARVMRMVSQSRPAHLSRIQEFRGSRSDVSGEAAESPRSIHAQLGVRQAALSARIATVSNWTRGMILIRPKGKPNWRTVQRMDHLPMWTLSIWQCLRRQS